MWPVGQAVTKISETRRAVLCNDSKVFETSVLDFVDQLYFLGPLKSNMRKQDLCKMAIRI